MGIKRAGNFKKSMKLLVVVCFLNVLISPGAYAEAGVAAGGVAASVAPVAKGEIKQQLPKSGNVTVNFKDVDIKTVLHYLSEMSGVDIIPSPGVDAKVTMRLRNKPWEVALGIVTRNYGYSYSREGDIIRVIPKGQLHAEEPITEVFPLNYVMENAEGNDKNITSLVSAMESVIVADAGEKVIFLPNANAIVVTAIPARQNIVRDLLSKVDKKTPQIMLEAKVIEITLDRNDQFGVDWNAVITASGAARPTTFPFDRFGNLPFLSGDQSRYWPLGDDAASASTPVFPGSIDTGATGFPFIEDAIPSTVTGLGDMYTFGTLDFSAFQAVLRLIDERDNTNILSSPRITTLNNQPATIKVISNIYLQKSQTSTDTAAIVTVEFEDEPREVGVILEVTPHVNENGEITVDLKPQISSNLTFTELQVSGAQNTVSMAYNSREADTQVMVRDGETIFIGGLITETTTKEDHTFPILGDLLGGIPLLGDLFQYNQDNIDKTEVVFFVTVHLLKDPRDSIKASKTQKRYEEYFAEEAEAAREMEIAEQKAHDEKAKVTISTGKLKTKNNEEIIELVPQADGKKKNYKPFLDFRKKK